jgi:hypothetical protein
MTMKTIEALADLYDRDETAWLDAMAGLARDGRSEDLDLPHLAEFLAEMARRDRREVESRLVVLLVHLLKWEHQADRRSRSWRATIIEQRQELGRIASVGVLRNHAETILADAYRDAVERAAAETGLPPDRFPGESPYSVEGLLGIDVPDAGR